MVAFRLRKSLLFLREPARKRKIYVFLICLACSIVFWIFIQLSGQSQAIVDIPVKPVGISTGQVLYHQSEPVIRVNVQSTGARLLSGLFSRRDSLSVFVGSLPMIQRDGASFHYLTSSQARSLIAMRSETGQTMLEIWPDTLFFQLYPSVSRKLPLLLDADLTFSPRFGLYGGIFISSDSIDISGPAHLIDSLGNLYTKKLVAKDLSAALDVELEVSVPLVHSSIRVSPSKVLVGIPVEEFTEGMLEVPLEVVLPDSLAENKQRNIRLFPPRVQIAYRVALRDYAEVDASGFRAIVWYPRVYGRENQLAVKLLEVPPLVVVDRIRPMAVDYLIIE